MNILFLQISDIHLTSDRRDNPIFTKLTKFGPALRELNETIDYCCVLICGDIAFSGQLEEYLLATELLEELRAQLKVVVQRQVDIIIIPGNHDCDCSFDTPARNILSQHLLNDPKGFRTPDTTILTPCLVPQRSFFDFCEAETGLRLESPSRRLCYSRNISYGGLQIHINCLNTAWLSQRDEDQGKTFIPIDLIEGIQAPSADLVITMMHHPTNWLQSENARRVREVLERTSDFLLTGHEHVSSHGTISRTTSSLGFFESGVFQDSNAPNVSVFSALIVKPDEAVYIHHKFVWNGSSYHSDDPANRVSLKRNPARVNGGWRPAGKFYDFLLDPGAHFTHPRLERVTLPDIFVPPDFRRHSFDENSTDRTITPSSGANFLAELNEHSLVLFFGAEKAGKTALAKTIFRELLITKKPVLLQLNTKVFSKLSQIKAAINEAFKNQYERTDFKEFLQLEPSEKVLLIDDFHLLKLNRENREEILKFLCEEYGSVYLFADESYRLRELSPGSATGPLLRNYEWLEILEMGHVLRNKLIDKWHAAGGREGQSDHELREKVAQSKHVVDTLLGRNLLPAYPLFVLISLQQIEANTPHKTTAGSYGYFYEFLITRTLSQSSLKDDVDLKYNFISEFAFDLYKRDQRNFSEDEFAAFTQSYNQEYHLLVSQDKMLRDLYQARVFTELSPGAFRFSYKYIYYYFIARYIAQNLHSGECRKIVTILIKKIHKEDCANILIFLSYLSKDSYILDNVLSSAKCLFKGTDPCDLNEHVKFLNMLQTQVPEIVLLDVDPEKNREKIFQKLDQEKFENNQNEEQEAPDEDDEEEEDEFLAKLMQFNTATKTIEVLGQILRNYAGSMRGNKKIEIAQECAELGLRAVNFLFEILEENLDGFVCYLTECFSDKKKPMDERDLVDKVKSFLFFITHMYAVSMLRKISQATGSEKLKQTYAELLVRSNYQIAFSMRMLDMSIKLDHFKNFPEEEVLKLGRELKDNLFAVSVLKRLVVGHFYLFTVDPKIRARICDKLKISVDSGKLLNPGSKKALTTKS